MMNMSYEIPTETMTNGVRYATDLAPFARFVNGEVTSAARYDSEGVWNVAYVSPKGRRLTKRVALEAVPAAAAPERTR